eukprot:sb/3469056/
MQLPNGGRTIKVRSDSYVERDSSVNIITPESYEYRFSDDESYSDFSDDESEEEESVALFGPPSPRPEQNKESDAENDQQSWCSWLVMATLKSIGIGFIVIITMGVVPSNGWLVGWLERLLPFGLTVDHRILTIKCFTEKWLILMTVTQPPPTSQLPVLGCPLTALVPKPLRTEELNLQSGDQPYVQGSVTFPQLLYQFIARSTRRLAPGPEPGTFCMGGECVTTTPLSRHYKRSSKNYKV